MNLSIEKGYSPHRYIELGVENKRAIEKINLLNIVGRSLFFSLLNYRMSKIKKDMKPMFLLWLEKYRMRF
ncbi:MAG TPA: hypothetical protein DEQ26_13125 [Flavobacteriaceae bacterium]|nr:hypothetical protein [Flavobacteriaceae bacterium]